MILHAIKYIYHFVGRLFAVYVFGMDRCHAVNAAVKNLLKMKSGVRQSLPVYRFCSILRTQDSCRVAVGLSRYCLSWLITFSVVLVMSDGRVEAKAPTEVFKLASRSIVVIKTFDEKGKLISSGSGVVIDKSGDVVTNFHVIERAARLVVIYDNKEYKATPKYVDRIRDVCSVNVPGLNALPVILGKTSNIEIGSTVYAIGFPMTVGLTFSDGVISSLRDTAGGHYIQFTAPISAGSSGGGLFDDQGQLIGIPTYFISQGQLLNFALPVEWVIDLPNRQVVKLDSKDDRKPDNEYLRQALALEESEDWVAQIQLCERWIKAFPKRARAWEFLGFAYANNGALGKAIESYHMAVQINPDSMQDWVELGQLYGKTKQRDKQMEALRMAVRINADYSGAWSKLAAIYLEAGQFENALEASQQVTRINPAHETAWLIMGYCYGKLGQQSKQINAYLQAIHMDQYSDDAYVCLGIAYGNAQRESEEEEAYLQALVIHPDEVSALFNLGHYYLRHGDKEKGRSCFERLKALDPELARVFNNDLTYRVYPETFRQR